MKKTLLIAISILAFNAHAIDIDTSKLCSKMQSCIIEEMKSQSMDKDMMQMMKPMVDNMCIEMNKRLIQATGQMGKDVAACMSAMESASCDVLMNQTDRIKECESLNKY